MIGLGDDYSIDESIKTKKAVDALDVVNDRGIDESIKPEEAVVIDSTTPMRRRLSCRKSW